MRAMHSGTSQLLDIPLFPVSPAKLLDLLPAKSVVAPSTSLDSGQNANRRPFAAKLSINQNDVTVMKMEKSKHRRSMTFNIFKKLTQKLSSGEKKPDNSEEQLRDVDTDVSPYTGKPKQRKSLLSLGRSHFFAQTIVERKPWGKLDLTSSQMQLRRLLKTKRSSNKKGLLDGAAHQWELQASEDDWKSIMQQEGLNYTLKSEVLLELFHNFLVSEFSDENLDFYLAVEYYKTIGTIRRRKNVANRILQIFVLDDAEQQVNLNSKLRHEIQDGLVDCPRDLYDNAQQAIFNLMQGDCYKRFLSKIRAKLKSQKDSNKEKLE